MSRLKQRVAEILQIPSKPGDTAGRAFDVVIITLIALNVLAVIVETMGDFRERYFEWLVAFETLSLAVFGAEYGLRLWSATAHPEYAHPIRGRLKWATNPYAIIDLLAILPALFLLMDLRFLRVVRVLRLLKIGRYSESMAIFTRVLASRAQALMMSLFLIGLALIIFSSMMYYAEHDAQPEAFADIPTAMWWGIVTLTTTGYGDVVPITAWGRLLGAAATIVGIGLLALPVGILASGFMEELERQERLGAKCPHCGGALGHPPQQ